MLLLLMPGWLLLLLIMIMMMLLMPGWLPLRDCGKRGGCGSVAGRDPGAGTHPPRGRGHGVGPVDQFGQTLQAVASRGRQAGRNSGSTGVGLRDGVE